jgi:cob(I)alamin adenosyltransferase
MKIYTRKGDDGTTGLLYGGRVPKDSVAPEAYGAVDEAQALLGVVRAEVRAVENDGELERLLVGLEHDLYVLMAELATDASNTSKLVPGTTAVTEEMVAGLEPLIDALTARFEPPGGFVIPGQNRVAALLDLARTVVRRAERRALAAATPASYVVPYLNRLSDLLWTMARWQEEHSLPARGATP